MKKITKIIVMGAMIIMSIGLFAGCSDYGYQFHYSVIDGNGEITLEDEALIRKAKLCSEAPWCELECSENSHVIKRLGGKKGQRLTFVAIPNEGYQVKEWVYNGEVVEGNKSTSFTAIAENYKQDKNIVTVEFEPIIAES